MYFLLVIWSLICVVAGSIQEKNVKFYGNKGNLSITAIFNNRFGEKCNEEYEKELEETVSAIWTIEALNKYNYLPGITIGLSLYGVCEKVSESLTIILENSSDNNIGIITTPGIYTALKSSVHIEHIIDTTVLVDVTIQLLLNLRWMNVNAVISDSANILKSFRVKASEEDIFTRDEFLITNSDSSMQLSEVSPVVVVIAAFGVISNLSRKFQDVNIKLILTPADFVFDVNSIDLPKNAIISLPLMGDKTALSRFMKNAAGGNEFFTPNPPTKGPLFIGTAASILKILKPIKTKLENRCRNANFYHEEPCVLTADFMNGFHSNKTDLLAQKSMKITPDDVEETLKVLKIEPSPNDEMFLYITSIINGRTSEDLAIFKIFNINSKSFQPVLTIFKDNIIIEITNKSDIKAEYFEDVKTGETAINSVQKLVGDKNEGSENITYTIISPKGCDLQDAQNHMCESSAINHTATTLTNNTMENDSEVAWRFLTWVSINTSLGFVGVTCTLSTMFFMIIRHCKENTLEGSPYFMLLLMISVIVTYTSSLPFHVDFVSPNGFNCWYRKNGPPVVFACLFSLLLSRSFLIAFNESSGEFENHLNGYLQSILWFFMFGVQISLISHKNLNCEKGLSIFEIFFTLGYDFFLLIVLVCVSPFIMRSKQNYKEGLLFSISVFFIAVIWSGWISFYILLPNEHKDAAVAIGLNLTASVLLFCIFIPQTYFMAAPYGRGRTLRSLSSLSRNILTDNSNFNLKSNQALNESGFGTIKFKNIEMGYSDPNFSSGRAGVERSNPERVDNFVGETATDVSLDGSQTN